MLVRYGHDTFYCHSRGAKQRTTGACQISRVTCVAQRGADHAHSVIAQHCCFPRWRRVTSGFLFGEPGDTLFGVVRLREPRVRDVVGLAEKSELPLNINPGVTRNPASEHFANVPVYSHCFCGGFYRHMRRYKNRSCLRLWLLGYRRFVCRGCLRRRLFPCGQHDGGQLNSFSFPCASKGAAAQADWRASVAFERASSTAAGVGRFPHFAGVRPPDTF